MRCLGVGLGVVFGNRLVRPFLIAFERENVVAARAVDLLGDVRVTFIGNKLYKMIRSKMFKQFKPEDDKQIRMAEANVNDMPIRSMVLMGGGILNFEMAEGLVEMMNGRFFRGLIKLLKHRQKK